MTELAPGTVIAEHYRVDRLLGEGGMGMVWAGVHLPSSTPVALKFLKGVAATSPEMHKRFYREARAAMSVKHPNVVRIFEVVRDVDGAPVMIMDFLEGESLGARLAREHRIPLRDFARIILPVVSAVGTAHSLGIVHRDLKPDNLFLVKNGEETELRVLDFGIAKLTATEGDAAQTAGLTGTGAMLGTPYYMSPEQVFGDRGIDQRADVWSVGVIIYECLAGKRPVNGENIGQLLRVITSGSITPLRDVAGQLPPDVLDLVSRMLVVDRNGRVPDLREVYDVFRRYTDVAATSFAAPTLLMSADESAEIRMAATPAPADGRGSTGMPLSTTSAPLQPPKRSPIALIGGVALVAIASAGIAVVVVNKNEPPPVGASASPTTLTVAEAKTQVPAATVAAAPTTPVPSVSTSASVPSPGGAAKPPLVPVVKAALAPVAKPKASTAPAPADTPTGPKVMSGGVIEDNPYAKKNP